MTPRARAPPDAPGARGRPGAALGLPWGCSATSPEDALGALGLLWGLLWSALPLTYWRVPVNTESQISQGKSWKT